MQSRRDLLQAHRLMTQRAALALLQAEPDPSEQPLRRINLGMVSGLLVAVILAAAFGVWGVLSPGHAQGLNAPGTLIVDSETGTPYVWCEHGKLCPVVNYASARLALGAASPNQRMVTQASLSGIPRGPLIGIPGLPEPLPDAHLLVGQPWSVCVQTVTNPGTLQRAVATTLVGGRSVGGHALSSGDALLVRSDGSDWLLWHGERLLIPATVQRNVLTALAAPAQPVWMPANWLNTFPQGPAFAPPWIAGFGARVRGPGGRPARVGQVFATSAAVGGRQQYYVLLRVGLAPVTQTQAALLNAAPKQAPQAVVTPAAVAGDRAAHSMPASDLPLRLPSLVSYDQSLPLCLVYSSHDAAQPGTLTMGGAVPSGGLPIGGPKSLTRIALPAGSAALVGVVPGPAATGPDKSAAGIAPTAASYFLISGARRYGLASPSVAAMLGYQLSTQRTLVPASLADLLPQGPALDPAAARDQAPIRSP